MNTWTPLWSQVVESTLWEEPLEVRVLFLTMLAIKDPDHVVRMPLRRLCKKANMEPAVVEEALNTLLGPDTRSIDKQEFEGRRLQVVEGGWLILNGEHYRQEMAKLMRRFYKASWARDKRAAAKGKKPLPGENAAIAAEGRGDQNGADAITTAALPVPRGNVLTPTPVNPEEDPAAARAKSFPHPPGSPPSPAGNPDLALNNPESDSPEPEEEPLGPDGEPLD